MATPTPGFICFLIMTVNTGLGLARSAPFGRLMFDCIDVPL